MSEDLHGGRLQTEQGYFEETYLHRCVEVYHEDKQGNEHAYCSTHSCYWDDDTDPDVFMCPVATLAVDASVAGEVIKRVRNICDEWDRDDAESMSKYNQHMSIGTDKAAEMLRQALSGDNDEWLKLANPEQHHTAHPDDDFLACDGCDHECYPDEPCPCCVKEHLADVKRLASEKARLANQMINEIPESYMQIKARALTAEATIKRVRELLTSGTFEAIELAQRKLVVSAHHLSEALDGDSDE